jgi:phosphate starvation-inducible PhoH-like protein
MNEAKVRRFQLEQDNPQRLASLCGLQNEHLTLIGARLGISIRNRGNLFELEGHEETIAQGTKLIQKLYDLTSQQPLLTADQVHLALTEFRAVDAVNNTEEVEPFETLTLRTPKLSVLPRSRHQNQYVHAILKHDINFGIGPAGTGKTYLAVACAVDALIKEQVNRILLVRPAVEAGEKLGFLPGDLTQKVDPYLRPLYDALYEMLGNERVAKLIERNIIEIAPLAFMRGRTLNNSFIILDESQNTTTAQMKMFLTRIGFGSTAVITGDHTQIDLPRGTRSGLVQATQILQQVKGISFTWFNSSDVVRHPIVQRIVDAYDDHEMTQKSESIGDRIDIISKN